MNEDNYFNLFGADTKKHNTQTSNQQVSVIIPGPTFSLFLHRLISLERDAEGILIGSVNTNTVTIESDTDSKCAEEVNVSLAGFQVMGSSGSFYDGAGKVDAPRVKRLLVSQQKDTGEGVVGWFRYRPFTTNNMSVRERAVNGGLSSVLGFPCVFLLIIQEQHVPQSLDFKYKAFVCPGNNNESMEAVEMAIANLQNTSGSNFKKELPQTVPSFQGQQGETFERLTSQQRKLATETAEFFENIVVDLRQTASKVSDNRRKLAEKQKRVAALRKMLAEISTD